MSVDVIAALRAILLADAGTAALAGTRVFGHELPGTQAAAMPRKAVVLRASGGAPLVGGYVEHGAQRVDTYCYGETFDQARRLDGAVRPALDRLRRTVSAGVLVHWVGDAGGYAQFRDPDGDWPAVWRSWQAFHADTEIAA